MAELAITSLMALAPAGAAAGTAAAGTAAVAAGSGALTALQGAVTVASMVSTILGGAVGYGEAREKARWSDINADGERLAAEQEALRIKREMIHKIGAARVSFAASGLGYESVSPVEGALRYQAETDIGYALDSGRMGTASRKAESAAYRGQGAVDLVGALVKAGRMGVDYKMDVINRG